MTEVIGKELSMPTVPTLVAPKNIDASTVILGFTGSIGSGCTYISEMIPEIGLPKKFRYYKLSDVIRKVLKSDNITDPSITQLQDKGNELRRKHNSNHYLVALLLNHIESEWNQEEDYGIIIDGIKNTGEVNALRQFPYFFLFSVHAKREIRCERAISDGRFKNEAEFNQADWRDQFEEYEYGQQVPGCSHLSDIVILNDGKIPKAAKTRRRTFIRKIYDRYIKLIDDLHESTRSRDITPTIDEICMTTAYVLSKSSSCLKRKVGCVIVDVDSTHSSSTIVEGKPQSYPFIISSGYNEVPLGSYSCIYHPNYEKCYRDYLQEEYAKTLKRCPLCGTEIKIKVECPFCKHKYTEFIKACEECHKEIDFIFKCSNCGENIFNLYIPGSEGAPGKLLDMCRALHAEETALLKLAKPPGRTSENLVLYVTTQPCNLCSNKIVLSGIKKVVYCEPYSMKEATEILENDNVDVVRFEGVKSSAFFRLYQ
jgi:deoxycytidylate deaminase